MPPAANLNEVFQATDPQPLASGDPYFVDLSRARDSAATVRLRQAIEKCTPGRHTAVAFSGHRGSGKSTELRQLGDALGSPCFMIFLDVGQYLDPLDVDYTDLFLLVSRQLLDALRNENVRLSENLLKDVEKWFREVTEVMPSWSTMERNCGTTLTL